MSRLLVILAITMLTWWTTGGALRAAPIGSEPTTYQHSSWTFRDGAPADVLSIDQTPDGFLWIGAGAGLYRFDGRSFEFITTPQDGVRRSAAVAVVHAEPTGTVWVGYYMGGVGMFRNGTLRAVPGGPSAGAIVSITDDLDGGTWIASDGVQLGHLSRYQDGHWQVVDQSWGFPSDHLVSTMLDRDGALWVVMGHSVLKLPRGSKRFQQVRTAIRTPAFLAQEADGRIWVLDQMHFGLLSDAPSTDAFDDPSSSAGYNAPVMMFTRSGNLWIKRPQHGVERVIKLPLPATSTPRAAPDDPATVMTTMSVVNAAALFEDHEGDVWVGNRFGIDRFRPISILPNPQLSSFDPGFSSLLRIGDGALLVISNSSLFRIGSDGAPTPIAAKAVDDAEFMCATRRGTAWVGRHGRLSLLAGDTITDVPLPFAGRPVLLWRCTEDGRNVLWLSVSDYGLYRLDSLGWTNFRIPTVPPQVRPWLMATDLQGRALLYYPRQGILRIDGSRVEPICRSEGLSVGLATVMYQSPSELLLGGEQGLLRYKGGACSTLSTSRYPFLRSITGITQTDSGQTWMIGGSGLARLATADLDAAFDAPGRVVGARIFGFDDGLPGLGIGYDGSDMAQAQDGRIWFVTSGGFASVDPTRLVENHVPPPVSIRSVLADGRLVGDAKGIRLQTQPVTLEITYAAPSLFAPSRVRFRYRLIGFDRDWIDAGTRYSAFYTGLGPGRYRFEVMAKTDEAAWKGVYAHVSFTVPPTLTQTWSFRAACAVLLLAFAAVLYRLRVGQLSDRLRNRLDAQLEERERIARDLHDTLLQGFQSLTLHFQAAVNRMSDHGAERALLMRALDRADDVLVEGRDRIGALRAGGTLPRLEQALATTLLQVGSGSPITFQLDVAETPRDVPPIIRDEILLIAREGLLNVVQHSRAMTAIVTLSYARHRLELRIVDDGIGIAPDIIAAGGRREHFGMRGMFERARLTESQLTISNRVPTGTEILLVVPECVAYGTRPRLRMLGWIRPRARVS